MCDTTHTGHARACIDHLLCVVIITSIKLHTQGCLPHSSKPSQQPLNSPFDAPMSTRIVGLGASAGGLEVLEKFFANVPPGSGLAYVVVQHLDPTRKAMLGVLLQRATPMPVYEAAEGMAVEPDAVYVIPPDAELTVAKGCLHLGSPQKPRGMRLPINVLFSSLARDQGDKAIGVVLSGMGADGTLGLQAIKNQGGLTLAQAPDSASFDSMPKSAIASGCIDIVALPADMPQRIIHAATSGVPTELKPEHLVAGHVDTLDTILNLLRGHSKHDLSLYKPSTLMRRIERRVAVHGLDSMASYAQFLVRNPQELDLLFAEMLIGVTSFFRDPDMWAELKDKILPDLLARRQDSPKLRAWVVGCSTGEEAYSLAMTFCEVCEATPFSLQIFATDLNAEAIAVARRGQYPAKLDLALSPERLARFFKKREGGFQINKDIRDMVLFAQHDVIMDPPFTRLDFLSCRNVLIYFDAMLQRRLMPLFHYSLRPGGLLVLGGSETVGRPQSMFTPLSPKSRIYLRSDHALRLGSVDFPVNHHALSRSHAQDPIVSTPANNLPNLQSLADQVLLQSFSPPAVLVNEGGDIIYISGRTGRYLEPAAGKANWNIHVMARPGLRTQLAVALRQASRDDKPVELHGLKLDDDSQRTCHVSVQAIREPKVLEGMVMVVFRDEALPITPQKGADPHTGSADTAMLKELAHSREEIVALRQEMQVSNEDLQAANEALQSANEELQSANEELTTSKEEAQSMNEELQTINGELQTKLDDLALAQSDMQNLLNSTDIATLFLDNELNVRRFTEQASKIFHLRDGDIGRPITDLATTLTYPDLLGDVQATLRTLTFSEKQIPATDGRWFSVRIMPYRTLANVIQGAVLTFVNITVAKELESRLRKG
jgi:two-component system, chemotaxis family, CheB/CheR fusion protein